MVFKRLIFKSLRDRKNTNLFTYWVNDVLKRDWTVPERQYNFKCFLIDMGLWISKFEPNSDGSMVFHIIDKKLFTISKIKYGF